MPYGRSHPTSAVLPAPRTILPNNLAALLLGSAVMVLLHEAVHWLTGAALGYRSILYSFGVTYPDVRARGPSRRPRSRRRSSPSSAVSR
ncbi:MAG: hypothetical protein HZY73_14720 [Micropruina sp.]|nr:MAG: hypothetical protein HZY73_14720 [Micropruina sp.]